MREMLTNGIIEPSSTVMVRKANDKYRFCVDYRKVNAVSKADAYPLPYMDTVLQKFQKAKFTSTLDLSQTYHQIPMEKESRPITAYTVPGLGVFQFTRKRVPATKASPWQRSSPIGAASHIASGVGGARGRLRPHESGGPSRHKR